MKEFAYFVQDILILVLREDLDSGVGEIKAWHPDIRARLNQYQEALLEGIKKLREQKQSAADPKDS